VVAGSIFTFSLTLGDYIIPQIIGTSARFIGLAVYQYQGTAGNIPLAAAFAVVPIVIMGVYLSWPGGWGPSMRSDARPLWLKVRRGAGLLFLHLPILLIFVYAFSTEDDSFTWPPPGLHAALVRAAWERPDIWAALGLSLRVARSPRRWRWCWGRSARRPWRGRGSSGARSVSLLVMLPIALPGIITGHLAALGLQPRRHPVQLLDHRAGHATFCVVVVYNNAVARFRRVSGNLVEASMDLGATYWQTLRHVILPNIATALLAGGMLAFALSFDEVIVTTFTAGQQQTLPIWMLEELVRPRERPVTNVVAMVVVLVTFLPILGAYYLTRGTDTVAGAGSDTPCGASDRGRDPMTVQFDTQMLIGSSFEAGTEGEETILNPRTGETILKLPRRGRRRSTARRGGAQGLLTWSRTDAAQRSQPAAQDRRPDRGGGGGVRAAREPQHRQAHQCGAERRDPGHRGLLPLLRGGGAEHARGAGGGIHGGATPP
jgi:putative spermidine/putrescine transport system permease protein